MEKKSGSQSLEIWSVNQIDIVANATAVPRRRVLSSVDGLRLIFVVRQMTEQHGLVSDKHIDCMRVN
jgi:hypothetical protein